MSLRLNKSFLEQSRLPTEQTSDAPAWKYLDHQVILVPVNESDSLKMLMEPELDLR
jgi:hypothetical protein